MPLHLYRGDTMYKDDLTEEQQALLEGMVNQFNKEKLTPLRRSYGKNDIVRNVDEDFLLRRSNTWRDVVEWGKWLNNLSSRDLHINKYSPLVQEQYIDAREQANHNNEQMLKRIESLSIYNPEFSENVGNVTSARQRFRQQHKDITAYPDEYVKRKYLDTLRQAEAKEQSKRDRIYADSWRKNLFEMVPEVYNDPFLRDFVNSLRIKDIMLMSYQDPYMTMEYFYENQYAGIFDVDTLENIQAGNIQESLYSWSYLLEQEKEQQKADRKVTINKFKNPNAKKLRSKGKTKKLTKGGLTSTMEPSRRKRRRKLTTNDKYGL